MELKLVYLAILFGLMSYFLFSFISFPSKFVKNMTVERKSNVLFEYEIVRYPTDVEISPMGKNVTIGMVTDVWNLRFGIVPVGGSGKRIVSVRNLGDKIVKVRIEIYGNITPLITFNKNNFFLKPGKDEMIEFYVKPSHTTLVGFYNGEIDIISEKPKLDFIYKLWGVE